MHGFMVGMGSETPRAALPLQDNMFDGVCVVECRLNEAEILRLMSNIHETKRALQEAVVSIQREVVSGARANGIGEGSEGVCVCVAFSEDANP